MVETTKGPIKCRIPQRLPPGRQKPQLIRPKPPPEIAVRVLILLTTMIKSSHSHGIFSCHAVLKLPPLAPEQRTSIPIIRILRMDTGHAANFRATINIMTRTVLGYHLLQKLFMNRLKIPRLTDGMVISVCCW